MVSGAMRRGITGLRHTETETDRLMKKETETETDRETKRQSEA